MKKAIKITLAVLGTLLVLLAIVVGIVLARVDAMAKTEIEQGGTAALGVRTTVDSVSLSFWDGAGSMEGFKVANPQGFDGPHFLKLDECDIALSVQTLLEDRVVIPTLTLRGVDINLEEKDGKKNYDTILESLKSFQATLPADKAANAQKPGKKFVIQRIVIKGITIHTDTLHGFGGKLQRVDLKIPEIEVKDIANDTDNGVAVSQVSGIIMTALFEAIVIHGAGKLPLEVLGGIGKGVLGLGKLGGAGAKVMGEVVGETANVVGEVGKGTVEAVGEVGKGTVEAVGEVGKGTVDVVGKSVEGIGKGVGGVFEEDKKK